MWKIGLSREKKSYENINGACGEKVKTTPISRRKIPYSHRLNLTHAISITQKMI